MNPFRTLTLIGAVSLIAVISLVFQARIYTTLFPFARQHRIEVFTHSIRSSRTVDPFIFWQLRDEYGAGVFTLSPRHTQLRETQELLIYPQSEWIEFATYESPYLVSRDLLIPWTNLPEKRYGELLDRITEQQIPAERLIFQDEDTRVFYTNTHTLVVAFIKPIQEMSQVNGLFNFPERVQEQLRGRLWANVTVFTVPDATVLKSPLLE